MWESLVARIWGITSAALTVLRIKKLQGHMNRWLGTDDTEEDNPWKS